MRNLIRLFFCTAILGLAAGAFAGHRVIVNNDSPLTACSKKKLAAIFLKKVTTWDDGTHAVPVDLDDGASARESFSKDVLGKSIAAVKSYWQQQIFSGKDVPPVEKASDSDVVAFVKATRGAVGYVSDTATVSGVRVLKVDE